MPQHIILMQMLRQSWNRPKAIESTVTSTLISQAGGLLREEKQTIF